MSSSDNKPNSLPENRPKNMDDMNALFSKMSSKEKDELNNMVRSCATEVLVKQSLPLSALFVGSIYYVNTKLLAKYQRGAPRSLAGYAILGALSMTLFEMRGLVECNLKTGAHLKELWNKYGMNEPTHQLYAKEKQQYSGNVHEIEQSVASSDYSTSSEQEYGRYQVVEQERPHQSYDPMYAPVPTIPAPRFADDAPFMSGTPSGDSGYLPRSSGSKTNQYGDVDFS